MTKTKTRILVGLFAFLLFVTLVMPTPVVAADNPIQLKDVPIGSIVYDPTWTWEFKTGYGYTGSGQVKPVEWIVVAKNHSGYPANSVTLISNELIGLYYFDNSTNRGSDYGSNHWGNSGSPNASHGIRPFLNETFYNAFSQKFKNAILTTNLVNVSYGGSTYHTSDKVFLPSQTELGGSSTYTYTIGANWGYFTSNSSRIARLGSEVQWYWTRSPYSLEFGYVRYVTNDGSFVNGYTYANRSRGGVRPALNLKSEIWVKQVDGKWEIVYNNPPVLNITNLDQNQTINGTGKITITGTVQDEENDTVTISATINGKTATAEISETSTAKNWILEWQASQINDGTYNNITVTAQDEAGNTTTKTYTGTIQVDKTPPGKPNISSSPTTPTNQNVSITITPGTDAGSGVEKTEYKIGSGNWIAYSNPFTVSENTTIKARTIDKAGNISEESSLTISNIVKTPPTITVTPNGNATYVKTQSATVTTSATNPATVTTRQYQWTTSSTFPTGGTWTNFTEGQQLQAPGTTGSHYLHVKVTDSAGNSKQFSSDAFNVDVTPPTAPTLIQNLTTPTNQDVIITITAGTDSHSGVDKTEYKVGNGNWTIYSDPFTVSENTTITARTIDKAGNISEEGSLTVSNIDKSPPTVKTPVLTVNSANQITVVPEAEDSSGLDATPYLYNRNGEDIGWYVGNLVDTELTPNTKYTYKYKAKDAIGNISDWSPEVSRYTQALDPVGIEITGRSLESITIKVLNDNNNGNVPETKIRVTKTDGTEVGTLDFSTEAERVIDGLEVGVEYYIITQTRNSDETDRITNEEINWSLLPKENGGLGPVLTMPPAPVLSYQDVSEQGFAVVIEPEEIITNALYLVKLYEKDSQGNLTELEGYGVAVSAVDEKWNEGKYVVKFEGLKPNAIYEVKVTTQWEQ